MGTYLETVELNWRKVVKFAYVLKKRARENGKWKKQFVLCEFFFRVFYKNNTKSKIRNITKK